MKNCRKEKCTRKGGEGHREVTTFAETDHWGRMKTAGHEKELGLCSPQRKAGRQSRRDKGVRENI